MKSRCQALLFNPKCLHTLHRFRSIEWRVILVQTGHIQRIMFKLRPFQGFKANAYTLIELASWQDIGADSWKRHILWLS